MESFRTDEFVSGQNLDSGSFNCLHVIPLFYLSLRMSLVPALKAFYCINKHVQDVLRYKCGFLKQGLGSKKREPLAGRGLGFNWFGLHGRLNTKNASMHLWEFSDL